MLIIDDFNSNKIEWLLTFINNVDYLKLFELID
jgi:hypothetical protein